MSNLTIAVDEQLVKLARVRAIQEGTSVSAKVREFLAAYAAGATAVRAGDPTAALLRMIDDVRSEVRDPGNAQEAAAGASWRDDLRSGELHAAARAESTPPANRRS